MKKCNDLSKYSERPAVMLIMMFFTFSLLVVSFLLNITGKINASSIPEFQGFVFGTLLYFVVFLLSYPFIGIYSTVKFMANTKEVKKRMYLLHIFFIFTYIASCIVILFFPVLLYIKF